MSFFYCFTYGVHVSMPGIAYDKRVTPFFVRTPVRRKSSISDIAFTCVPPHGHPGVSGKMVTILGVMSGVMNGGPTVRADQELLIVGQFEGINNGGCGWGIEHE